MVPAAPHLNSAELSFFLFFFFLFFSPPVLFHAPPISSSQVGGLSVMNCRWTVNSRSSRVRCTARGCSQSSDMELEFTVEPGEFSPPPR